MQPSNIRQLKGVKMMLSNIDVMLHDMLNNETVKADNHKFHWINVGRLRKEGAVIEKIKDGKKVVGYKLLEMRGNPLSDKPEEGDTKAFLRARRLVKLSGDDYHQWCKLYKYSGQMDNMPKSRVLRDNVDVFIGLGFFVICFMLTMFIFAFIVS